MERVERAFETSGCAGHRNSYLLSKNRKAARYKNNLLFLIPNS